MASTQFTDGSLVTPSMTNVPGDRGLTFRAFRRDFPDDITLVVHPLADGGPRPGRSINHFKFQLVLHDASPSVFSEPYLSPYPRPPQCAECFLIRANSSAQTSEPRNEIADELCRVLRLIARGEPLTHGLEGLPDADVLRTNGPVLVELFGVLCLNNLERSHDQIVRDIIGRLRHAAGCDYRVGRLVVTLCPLLEAGDQRGPMLTVNETGIRHLIA